MDTRKKLEQIFADDRDRAKIGESKKIVFCSGTSMNEMENIDSRNFAIREKAPEEATSFKIVDYYWVDYGRDGVEVQYYI